MKTGHLGLNVTDLERSISFYVEVFGFEIVASSLSGDKKYAFLGLDGQIIVTLWEQSSGTFETDRPGLHHFAFEVESVEKVKQHKQHLRNLGVSLIYSGVVPHAEGANSGGIYFLDPDGIRLEIYTPHGAAEGAEATTDGPSCGFF